MVAHVTHLSQKRPYGAAMLFVPAFVAVLASRVGGPVAEVIAFFLGCVALGGVGAAWASMIASALDPRPGQGRVAALCSAQLERWAPQGLAIGSAVGLVLLALDAWLPT